MKESDNAIFMEQNEYDEYVKNKKIKINSDEEFNTGISVYEMNKEFMEKEKVLTNKIIKEEKIPLLSDFLKNSKQKYYCLLNPNYHYLTVFNFNSQNFKKGSIEIIQLCKDLGQLKGIYEESGTIEIWIQLNDSKKIEVFYLFGYDKGMVEI